MKSLGQIREQFLQVLSPRYSSREIDIIFYALAENYLHKDKSMLKLGLHELVEDSDLKYLLFQGSLLQLTEGIPYQYVVGNAEFYGCTIQVNPTVLIPRPETEELVEWVLKDTRNKQENVTIMDLCSGSGCIAIALSKNLPEAHVYGLEIDENAVKLASANAEYNQVQVEFTQSDLLETKVLNYTEPFDIIISNPPYIREFEKEGMEDIVLKNEPEKALFVPDTDPLVFYRKIIDFASVNLKSSGTVYVEINQELGKETKELFLSHFNFVELKQDLSGNFRMIKAKGIN